MSGCMTSLKLARKQNETQTTIKNDLITAMMDALL